VQARVDELMLEVRTLTERNTLLAAEKIKFEQLQVRAGQAALVFWTGGEVFLTDGEVFLTVAMVQRDWDKHMITCNNRDGGFVSALPPPAAPAEQSLSIDGPTQIVVHCSGAGGGVGDAHAAHVQELQEKNQLLQRLAGLHEAMEKIRCYYSSVRLVLQLVSATRITTRQYDSYYYSSVGLVLLLVSTTCITTCYRAVAAAKLQQQDWYKTTRLDAIINHKLSYKTTRLGATIKPLNRNPKK